jgi:glyoxylase-like metal-dependent hydrolase (beta-lactamase superfamily II)
MLDVKPDDGPPDQPEVYRGLTYPYGRHVDPPVGEPQPIAEGVWWVRFPMPMSLDHINLWLLEDGEGWTVVDTCLALPDARKLWEGLFEGFMGGRPVTRVICTHMHPDHVGLAGWLCERFDCDLWMSRSEYLMCRLLVADTGREAPQAALDFYHRAGYTEEQLERYKARFGFFGKAVSPLPDRYIRLVDLETLVIGGRYWQVMEGSGHSPEHCCLYCPALKLLISGDQVLPRITPNVSVFPTEPEGDPLKNWLRSGSRLRERLPEDLLVLPSHEAPFTGLHVRLSQLLESHMNDLNALFAYLDEPRRAVDCFPALFNREIDAGSLGLATGETIAHLNCLLWRRRIRRSRDADGVYWYVQDPDTIDMGDHGPGH